MAAPNKELDETLTADGDSSVISWDAGEGLFTAYGDFGGGTAELQASFDDGSTWIALGSAVRFTSDGTGNFNVPPQTKLKVNLSGSSSPSLEVEILEVFDIVIGR